MKGFCCAMRLKDVNYFDLFIEGARICYKASEQLEQLVNGNSMTFRANKHYP